ncbi:hypothetical protein [Hyphomicrobium sp.]|jgi:hypothetical protein|uniref:hypothetical protein n=1 Tax=Hyphomicrobium sp. TaxID=82 RepID=UPI00356A3219
MGTFSKLAASAAKLVVLSLVPNISLAMAATSDDLFNTYFANVLDGAPCFARTYDDAHLAKHPGQQVRAIEVDLSKANSDGRPNAADHFTLGFALMLTSGPSWFGQAASCKTNDADFECYLESDGGVFRLTPQKDGGLRLETGENGLSLEGTDGDIELTGKDGIDRVFDLVTSKAECQAAAAFFEGGSD